MVSFNQHDNCHLLGWTLCSALVQVLYVSSVLSEKARLTKSPSNCTVLPQLICQQALVDVRTSYGLYTAFILTNPCSLTFKCNFESWKVFFPRNLSFSFKFKNLFGKQLCFPIPDPSRCAGDAAQHRSKVGAQALLNELTVREVPCLTEMTFLLLCALTYSCFSCSINVYFHWQCLLKKFQLEDDSLKEIRLPFRLQKDHSNAQIYHNKLPPSLAIAAELWQLQFTSLVDQKRDFALTTHYLLCEM